MSRQKKEAKTSSRIIRELIKIVDKSGRTYSDIAPKAGISLPNLSYWKHGYHSPRVDDLENVAEVLGYRLTFEEIEPCLL